MQKFVQGLTIDLPQLFLAVKIEKFCEKKLYAIVAGDLLQALSASSAAYP